MWLPKAVELSLSERFKAQVELLEKLRSTGITSQYQMINAGFTPNARRELANRTGIQLDALVEMVKFCDIYRMGSNLAHIRIVIYYDMGLDTWQKWAEQDADRIITMFKDYINRYALEGVHLVPWPKEVRNGIEWARMHLSIYAPQW